MKLTVNNFEEKEAKRSYEEPFFRAVISIKDDGTSGPREFIRALLYSSAIESPDIEKVLDVQKYAEYTEYMDDERKDPKGILGFNITDKKLKLIDGKLGDIAPSILWIMGLDIPSEMTGNILIKNRKKVK